MCFKVPVFIMFVSIYQLGELFSTKPNLNTRIASLDKNFEDIVISSDVIIVRKDISLIDCLRQCNGFGECSSFFYNHFHSICQLHDVTFTDRYINSTLENGWNYYLIKGCPNGWIMNTDSCYLINSVDVKTWHAAKTDCENKGGVLAEITIQEEQTFIVSIASTVEESSKTISSSPIKGGFWVGGNDIGTEGKWVWSTSNEAFQYTAWYPDEPNSYVGEEDCMACYEPLGYAWVDMACTEALNFICERKVLN